MFKECVGEGEEELLTCILSICPCLCHGKKGMKEAWGILIDSKIHLKKLSSCLNKIREIMKCCMVSCR